MVNSLLLSGGAIAGIIIGGVALLLVIIVLIWWVKTRNAFVRLKNRLEEAWATVDVYLKKRFDLIPNLVATVKGYAKHESETLEKVVSARSAALSSGTPEQKMEANKELTSSLRTFLHAVSESYPQLQANANFLDLQRQLKEIESEIEKSRRYYNGVVKAFNTKLEVFPATIIGKRMGEGYERKRYFEIDDPIERQNVKVEF